LQEKEDQHPKVLRSLVSIKIEKIPRKIATEIIQIIIIVIKHPRDVGEGKRVANRGQHSTPRGRHRATRFLLILLHLLINPPNTQRTANRQPPITRRRILCIAKRPLRLVVVLCSLRRVSLGSKGLSVGINGSY